MSFFKDFTVQDLQGNIIDECEVEIDWTEYGDQIDDITMSRKDTGELMDLTPDEEEELEKEILEYIIQRAKDEIYWERNMGSGI